MNRLKELRKEKKLSQKQIALELDTPLRTYQRWENDETQIKPDKAQTLANFFGVNEGYLLGYSDAMEKPTRKLLTPKEFNNWEEFSYLELGKTNLSFDQFEGLKKLKLDSDIQELIFNFALMDNESKKIFNSLAKKINGKKAIHFIGSDHND